MSDETRRRRRPLEPSHGHAGPLAARLIAPPPGAGPARVASEEREQRRRELIRLAFEQDAESSVGSETPRRTGGKDNASRGLPAADDEFESLLEQLASAEKASDPRPLARVESAERDGVDDASLEPRDGDGDPISVEPIDTDSYSTGQTSADDDSPDSDPLSGVDGSDTADRRPAFLPDKAGDEMPGLADDERFWLTLDQADEPDDDGEVGLDDRDDPQPETIHESSEAATDEGSDEIDLATEEAQPLHVATRRGRFAGTTMLSLLSVELGPNEDGLNHPLSAFADLSPGQVGFIRFSLRAAPGFRSHSKQWLAARRLGHDPDQGKRESSGLGLPLAWARYGLRLLWHELNKDSGAAPPLAPGKLPSTKPIPNSQLSDEEVQMMRDATLKQRESAHFEVVLRLGAAGLAEDRDALEQIAGEAASQFGVYTTPYQELVFTADSPIDAARGYMGLKPGDELVLSAGELALLASPPDDTTNPQGLVTVRSGFRMIAPPNPLTVSDPLNAPPGMLALGVINPRSDDARILAMRNSELDQHMFICGRTGTGKSELLKWIIYGVAHSDYPIVVIDPHGALTDDLLPALLINCPQRARDICLVDVGNPDWPVAINPLDIHRSEQIEPTVSAVMEMLDRQLQLSRSGAPRAMNWAQQALAALAEANIHLTDASTKCTLLHITTFFLDPDFRRLVVGVSSNMTVQESFDVDSGLFEKLSERQQIEQTQPIIRAFQPLANDRSFAAVFTSCENRLDFSRLIRKNKIVLLRLSRFSHQQHLGDFVGALVLPWILSGLDSWGRKRDETGAFTGKGCRIFVDEAPRLMGPNTPVEQILAEARKWDLGLVFASQYLDQFSPSVIKATLANTGSKLVLSLEPQSAKVVAQAISDSGKVSALDISALPNYHFYGNVILSRGEGERGPSGIFSAACLRPIPQKLPHEHRDELDQIIERSRREVSNSRTFVEEKRKTLVEDIKSALHVIHRDRVTEDNREQRIREGIAGVNPDAESVNDAYLDY